MKIYTVRDDLAEEFGPLFEQKNDATAKRSVEELLKDKPYPADYSLYCIGEFDHDTGTFKPFEKSSIVDLDFIDAEEVMDRLVKTGRFKEVKKDGE